MAVRWSTTDAIQKAIQHGVRGIIAGGIDDVDLRELLGYELGVAITGSEEIGITLVITEGFGHIAMAEQTFTLLKAREGMKTSINGATQIRAGVVRPEILIPLVSDIVENCGSGEGWKHGRHFGSWELGAYYSGTVFRAIGTRHGTASRTPEFRNRGTGPSIAG